MVALNWSTREEAGTLVAMPAGRIDESNWQAFAEVLVAAIAAAASRRLVIDLSGVDYMSSRGLRALSTALTSATAVGVPVLLAAPGPAMRQILAISRYDKLFPVHDTVVAAVA